MGTLQKLEEITRSQDFITITTAEGIQDYLIEIGNDEACSVTEGEKNRIQELTEEELYYGIIGDKHCWIYTLILTFIELPRKMIQIGHPVEHPTLLALLAQHALIEIAQETEEGIKKRIGAQALAVEIGHIDLK